MTEIAAEQFEALRRRIWAERFIFCVPAEWKTSPPNLVAWVNTTEYSTGDLVSHNQFMWQAMTPTLEWATENGIADDIYVPVGSEPAPDSIYWCRVARTWVYTDFDPNSDCYMTAWEGQTETDAGWFYWPAYLELPAPLNGYTQQTKNVETTIYNENTTYKHGQLIRYEAGGAVYWWDSISQAFHPCIYHSDIDGDVTAFPEDSIWPANRIYREHQKKLVEFSQFYKYGSPHGVPMHARYDIVGGQVVRHEDARLILGGYIGTAHHENHSVEGSTVPSPWAYPYHVVAGHPRKAKMWEHLDYNASAIDSYEDIKLEGYQSFVELVMESGGFGAEADSDWIPQMAQVGFDYELETIPKAAWMNDPHWRCNESALELCLKKIGHFDWYLDLEFPPDSPQHERRTQPYRFGCWRRFWRYSHGCPSSAYIHNGIPVIWPQELGLPPYYEQEFTWDENSHTYPDAEWWFTNSGWAAHFTAVMDAYDAAVADGDNAAAWAACANRHDPARWLWNPIAAEVTEVPGATIMEYQNERGFWLAAYETKQEMLDDMTAVLDIFRWIPVGEVVLNSNYRAKSLSSGQSTWTAARDGGSWGAWTGITQATSVNVQLIINNEDPLVTYGFESYTRGEMFETRAQLTFISTLSEAQLSLIEQIDKLLVALTITGFGVGGTAQSDTNTHVYNYNLATELLGITDDDWSYFGAAETVLVEIDPAQFSESDGIKLQLADQFADAWTKAPPTGEGIGYSHYACGLTIALAQTQVWGKLKTLTTTFLEDYITPAS
jgi:hypothetical protein